jgi:hypothetical protein
MNTIRLMVLLTGLLLLALVGRTIVHAQGCGVEPPEVKPVPPPGCKDMRHACACDNQGNNCHWAWVCVPR